MLIGTSNVKLRKTNAKRFKGFLISISLFLVVTLLSGCSAGGGKPAALQVTSTPEASVFLDGKHLGKTPFFSDQMKAGKYLLKISAGEAFYVENVTLSSGTLTVVNRELNNNFMAQAGEMLKLVSGEKGLFVSSMPGEADLTIDGKALGKTPYFVQNMDEGEHKLALSKLGYVDRQFSIKTSNTSRLDANVTLASEIARGIGNLPNAQMQIQKVEISETPQGFLRVRKDPSLSSPEIGRVKTGDKLELIQETKDWLKVTFEGKQGWISAQFAKKF